MKCGQTDPSAAERPSVACSRSGRDRPCSVRVGIFGTYLALFGISPKLPGYLPRTLVRVHAHQRASSISSVRCSLAVYKHSFWSSMFMFLVNYPLAYHVFRDQINHRSNWAWDLDLCNSLWHRNCSSLHIPQKLHSWFTFDLCHGMLSVIPSHAYNIY